MFGRLSSTEFSSAQFPKSTSAVSERLDQLFVIIISEQNQALRLLDVVKRLEIVDPVQAVDEY